MLILREPIYSCRRSWHRVRDAVSARHRGRAAAFRALRAAFYRRLWTEASARVGACIDPLGDGFYRISRDGRSTIVQDALVPLDAHLTLRLAGSKPLAGQLLAAAGLPVGRFLEYGLHQLDKAHAFVAGLGRRAVVKPAHSGAAGKGVTVGIESFRELERASIWASAYSRRLMVEEEADGDSYRLLYLRGTLVDAIRRRRPAVTGDGRSTIAELIADENARRLSETPVTSLHALTVDPELRRCLSRQGIGLRHVPAAGQRITVKRVANQNAAFENETVTPLLHASTVEAGRRAAEALGVELAGVDIMTTDITRPLAETGGVIGEVNTTPALHHHYLVREPGQAAPVADRVLIALLEVAS